MASPRLTCSGWTTRRLAVDLGEVPVHHREVGQRLHHREPDQVREGDLAAAGALELVVDHDPVVGQQLGRHRAHAGRRGHGQRGVHVLDHDRRRAAQRGLGAVAAGAGRLGRAARCARRPACPEPRSPSGRGGRPAGGPVVGAGRAWPACAARSAARPRSVGSGRSAVGVGAGAMGVPTGCRRSRAAPVAGVGRSPRRRRCRRGVGVGPGRRCPASEASCGRSCRRPGCGSRRRTRARPGRRCSGSTRKRWYISSTSHSLGPN